MKDNPVKPSSGYLGLLLLALLLAAVIYGISIENPLLIGIPAVIGFLMIGGFFFVNPNDSRVLTLFGEYKGTVLTNGFFFTNPFYSKKKISLRANNFESERLKVNDQLGNPIEISAIIVWRVKDAYSAAFKVDDYINFVKVQSDSAVRHLASQFPYDSLDDHQQIISLRSGHPDIHDTLEKELVERMEMAGLEVLEARLGYLAYAQEIAGAMLKRQQAEAVIAARKKIVEGAVSMVESALDELSKKEIVHLDEDKKAAMVSNLMVILCSDKEVTPVVNTGTLHH